MIYAPLRCLPPYRLEIIISQNMIYWFKLYPQAKIVSEYDKEITQSQTADNPVAWRGRAAQPSQDTRKTN